MDKIILHIDFDSFFASVEQQYNPRLRNKPIGVTAKNGRTCIIAASREAKKLGVRSPSRTFDALEKVPYMIFVPAHFEKYWEITQKFLNICKDYSPFVELFSLDEVFMDITSTQSLFKNKYEIIKQIRQRINNEIGEYITVSVGVSHNKLLAKLASGINKPNGLFEISFQNLGEVYEKIKLTDFCGIGERIALRLNRIGIYTPSELKSAPLRLLIKEFKDVEGRFLKQIGLGQDSSEVISYYMPEETKSVGRNYCLPQNEYDKRIVFQNIYELCEEIAIKLRRIKMKGRTVGVYLGGQRSAHGRKSYNHHFNTSNEIFKGCLDILKQFNFSFEKNYTRRISVWVGNLEKENYTPLSLFSEENRKEGLWKTVDKINDKFGDHTIRNGFLLYADKLKTVPNGYMADRYERTKLTQEFP